MTWIKKSIGHTKPKQKLFRFDIIGPAKTEPRPNRKKHPELRRKRSIKKAPYLSYVFYHGWITVNWRKFPTIRIKRQFLSKSGPQKGINEEILKSANAIKKCLN